VLNVFQMLDHIMGRMLDEVTPAVNLLAVQQQFRMASHKNPTFQRAGVFQILKFNRTHFKGVKCQFTGTLS